LNPPNAEGLKRWFDARWKSGPATRTGLPNTYKRCGVTPCHRPSSAFGHLRSTHRRCA